MGSERLLMSKNEIECVREPFDGWLAGWLQNQLSRSTVLVMKWKTFNKLNVTQEKKFIPFFFSRLPYFLVNSFPNFFTQKLSNSIASGPKFRNSQRQASHNQHHHMRKVLRHKWTELDNKMANVWKIIVQNISEIFQKCFKKKLLFEIQNGFWFSRLMKKPNKLGTKLAF